MEHLSAFLYLPYGYFAFGDFQGILTNDTLIFLSFPAVSEYPKIKPYPFEDLLEDTEKLAYEMDNFATFVKTKHHPIDDAYHNHIEGLRKLGIYDYRTSSIEELWPMVIKKKILDHPDVKDILNTIGSLLGNYDKSFMLSKDTADDIQNMIENGEEWWKKYPLCVLSPVENRDSISKAQKRDRRGDEKIYQRMYEDVDEYEAILNLCTDNTTVDWYTLPHVCQYISGWLLYTILSLAYPQRKWYVVNTPSHTWILSDDHKNYDLSYPFSWQNRGDSILLLSLLAPLERIEVKDEPNTDMCT